MATTMNTAQMKDTARNNVLEILRPVYEIQGAEMVGNTAYLPQTVNGQEIWVEVKLTTKNWYDTKTSACFDPFVARQEYEEERSIKEQEKAEKAAIKAAKVAEAQAKKEALRAEREAKKASANA